MKFVIGVRFENGDGITINGNADTINEFREDMADALRAIVNKTKKEGILPVGTKNMECSGESKMKGGDQNGV